MLKVSQAILHVFDFEEGSAYLSDQPLDLESRATRSYVQRRLRRIVANAESKHGEFSPESGFAGELEHYLGGGTDFVSFSTQIAQWFWEELRRAEELEQCDLLVADFRDTDEGKVDAASTDEQVDAAFDGPAGKRFFAVVLLPRKQAFMHEVGGSTNDITRVDTTLPSPTQKVDSYVLVDCEAMTIDFHDKERSIGGAASMVIPEKFLQCVSSASSHEVIDEVSVIVSDIAEEYGLTPAVEVSRAKAYVAEKADQDEVIEPAEVGRRDLRGQARRAAGLRGARPRGKASRGGPRAPRRGKPPDQEPQDPHGHRGRDRASRPSLPTSPATSTSPPIQRAASPSASATWPR